MTYAGILEIEDANTDKIYLHREGTFLKAYERSAFLFSMYVQTFKISRRFIKSVNRHVVSLGFPQISLKKWLYNAQLLSEEEKLLVFTIEKSVDEVEYHNWLEGVKVQTNQVEGVSVHTSVIEHQPVFKTAVDNLMHVISLTKNFGGNLRHPFGDRAKSLAYDIGWGVRNIYDAPDRDVVADGVMSRCRELCFLLQMMKDAGQISTSSFALASERIVSVSRQIDGLRKKGGSSRKDVVGGVASQGVCGE